MTAKDWTSYQIIATGDGYKLEKWGNIILLRPDPQVIWKSQIDMAKYPNLVAHYLRDSSGGGKWNMLSSMPNQWQVGWQNLKFYVKPMGFKHTGLFPEQSVNWDKMVRLIKGSKRDCKVLNLFGYTGGATVACAAAGATVTHVDAASGMVERAKDNCMLNAIPQNAVRYIVDDCLKFVGREIKRGKTYDAIIMDPPSYGRGPNGEMWKIEDSLFELCHEVTRVLSSDPLFYLINSYTTGLQPTVLNNILSIVMQGYSGTTTSYEVNLPTQEGEILLPCGGSGLWQNAR